jgi:8-oxo-dGTP pyrophosphatase MutT (NUDIX family)
MSVSYTQRRRDSDQQQRKREIYDSGNSAVILPYDPARKTVLLTRQLRLPIFLQDGEENVLEACAGKLDGATAEERIRKEIEEELGYRIVEAIVRTLRQSRIDHGEDFLLHLFLFARTKSFRWRRTQRGGGRYRGRRDDPGERCEDGCD